MQKRSGSAWLPILLGLLVCAGIFWALWNMWEHISGRNAQGAEQVARVSQLEEEKKRLENLLKLDPCVARESVAREKSEKLSGGTGEKQAASKASAQKEKELPVGNIEKIEAACVFLITPMAGNRGLATGSGFFVAPGIVLTNRHVVENGDGRVFVTSKFLGQPMIGKTLAMSRDENDFAIVSVPMPADTHATVLPLADSVQKTQKVGAWGYPGLVGKADPAYRALITGKDFKAAPELSYSEGVISAILDRKPRMIIHTAPLSPGNSGGPLVNEKGEVAGINTQISLDEDSYRQASIAIAADSLKNFLQQNGIKISNGGTAAK